MAWTGLTAAALWSVANHRWALSTASRFVVAFLAAVGLHTAWDTTATVPGYAVIGVVSLALLTFIGHRLGVRDRAAQLKVADEFVVG